MRHPAGDQCIDVGAPDADQPRADPDALARDWEWQQVSDLAAGQALVLLYVAERADGTGHCFRHARTTAAALPLTEGSTAQRLKELARMGLLTRQCERRRDGSFTGRWLIQLTMPSGLHSSGGPAAGRVMPS